MRLAHAITSSVIAGLLVFSTAAPGTAAPNDLPSVQADELGKASSMLALINPSTKLSPEDYTPKDLVNVAGTSVTLRPEAAEAVEALVADARKSGHSIKVLSAFRSYQRQSALFNQYQSKYGTAYAERISARPGTSEHQLGLAADLGYTNSYAELKEAFGQTPAGQWIAKHAVDYGLIIRYPVGMESITGYKYEPWHVRYIGEEQAKAMAASGAKTYEEYYSMLKKQAQKEAKATDEAKVPEVEQKKPESKSTEGTAKPGSGVLQKDDLIVLRFLPPYRDWSFGFIP